MLICILLYTNSYLFGIVPGGLGRLCLRLLRRLWREGLLNETKARETVRRERVRDLQRRSIPDTATLAQQPLIQN